MNQQQQYPAEITDAKAAEIARAIVIDHQFTTSVLPEAYKPQVYAAMVNVSPAFGLGYIPEADRTPDLCMQAYKQQPLALRYFPKLQISEDLCEDAIQRDGTCLAYVPEQYKTKNRCLSAIDQAGPEVLDFVPYDYRQDKEFMLDAIAISEYAPLKLDSSIWDMPKSFWMQAVDRNPFAIAVVPKHYRDRLMYAVAVSNDGNTIAHIPEDAWTKDLCETALQDKKFTKEWHYREWDPKVGLPYGIDPFPQPSPVYAKAERIVQGMEIAKGDQLMEQRRKESSHGRTDNSRPSNNSRARSL